MQSENIRNKAAMVQCLICDVDGVLTPGKLIYTDEGIATKTFHVQDGLGLKLLQLAGIDVAIITSCASTITQKRMRDLGVEHVYIGALDKITAYQDLQKKLKLPDSAIGYVGDDIPDLPLLQRAGFAVAVNNAVPLIKEYADYVTQVSGGKGAVREVCDFLLQVRGLSEQAVELYLHKYRDND
jgi:3-deoxy-D-manno-octulosonate 8-phosphate phosphatase (KDO 8-P phosphatase)